MNRIALFSLLTLGSRSENSSLFVRTKYNAFILSEYPLTFYISIMNFSGEARVSGFPPPSMNPITRSTSSGFGIMFKRDWRLLVVNIFSSIVIRALLNSCGDIFSLCRTISIVFVRSGVNSDVKVTIGLATRVVGFPGAPGAGFPGGGFTTAAGFSN